jgi:hypothetical protein
VSRRRAAAIVVTIAIAVVAAASGRAQVPGCRLCIAADFWVVDPGAWKSAAGSPAPFVPERALLDAQKRPDFGIAFSGGGTRSATATIGELRALVQNGWLDRARYITGVSGGSWAAVPFTFSSLPLGELLGPMERPEDLSLAVLNQPPQGRLPRAIAGSRLAASGAFEGAEFASRQYAGNREVFSIEAQKLLNQVFGTRSGADQTYADMLARAFVGPVVPGARTQLFAWDATQVNRLTQLNPQLTASDFLTAPAGRPFLVVGGSMIYAHDAFPFPRLVPVEMTPMYIGARQQFGGRVGGVYVSPLAYDADAAAIAERLDTVGHGVLRIVGRGEGRRFTLGDVVAVSGAAPLLGFTRGKPLSQLADAARFFPIYNHLTIRGGSAPPAVLTQSHGDGGFTDNLGLMPLLARQVHNVMVFVNAAESFEDTIQLQVLFAPIERFEDWGGDRSMAMVFPRERWQELKAGLEAARAAGGPVFYCARDWEVLGNVAFNIAPYRGLNICFIYNHDVPAWREHLAVDTRHALETSRRFRNFPWYSTGGQLQLNNAQVNLLANLSAWSLVQPGTVRRVREALCEPLGTCPPQAR